MSNTSLHSPKHSLRWLLALSALEGLAAALWLLRIPSESGLSFARLGMLLLLLAGTGLSAAGLLPALQARLLPRWQALLRSRRRVFWLLLAAGNGFYLLTLPADLTDVAARAVLTRSAPLLCYLSALSLQVALLAPGWKTRLQQEWRIALPTFGVLLLAWGFIARSRWGLQPLSEYWYEMGVPILETQLLLVWGLLLLGRKVLACCARRGWRLSARQADAALALGLYLLSVFLWQSAPTRPTWFFSPPAAPNFQTYPASDALRYDSTAQNVLIGNGLRTENQERTLRPLYTALLAALHALTGLGYENVARAQVWVLAFFVVLLYQLGRALHSRTAGVLLAGLLCLQGYTNIAYANLFTISHARLLMPDLPMAMLIAGFLLLSVRWQSQQHPARRQALYSGAALGAMMLVRPESIIAGTAAALTALLRWRHPSRWAQQVAVFALGTALITTPWVARNWARYGHPFFDAPTSRLTNVIRRALESPLPEPPEAPAPPPPTASPTKDALPAPPPSPQELGAYMLQHYLNSEIQSFLALPATFRLPETLLSYSFVYAQDLRLYHSERSTIGAAIAQKRLARRLKRENSLFWAQCCQTGGYLKQLPFWPYFQRLPRQALLPLLGNLLLVSLGIGVAVRRLGWAGALPALVHVLYLMLNAVFLVSGGRYIQPVNWIVVLYYSLGLGALTLGWLAGGDSLLRAGAKTGPRAPRKGVRPPRWAGRALPVGAVLLLGLVIPIGERLPPQRYSASVQAHMEQAALESLGAQPTPEQGLEVLSGRALYPRYLEAGGGTPSSRTPLDAPQPYGRLVFFLIGERNYAVRLPLDGLHSPFPQGGDVVVLGCVQPGEREFLDALAVVRMDAQGQARTTLWRSADVPLQCP